MIFYYYVYTIFVSTIIILKMPMITAFFIIFNKIFIKFKMKIIKAKETILILILLLNSCAVIRPGQVGIKQKLGKFSDKVVKEGTVLYNPITSKIIKVSTRTQNIKLLLNLPSKEGLSVNSEISILYRLEEQMVA